METISSWVYLHLSPVLNIASVLIENNLNITPRTSRGIAELGDENDEENEHEDDEIFI